MSRVVALSSSIPVSSANAIQISGINTPSRSRQASSTRDASSQLINWVTIYPVIRRLSMLKASYSGLSGLMLRQIETFKQGINIMPVTARLHLTHQIRCQMRCEGLNEVIHIATQEGSLAEADAGYAVFKQMAGIERNQSLVLTLFKRHGGNNANPQAEADIGFDHIGVDRREHHLGFQATVAEGFIQLGASGKTEHIGDQRPLRQRLKRQLRQFGQRMPLRHHHRTVPAITGHHDQIAEM